MVEPLIAPPAEQEDVQAVIAWADLAMADLQYRVRIGNGEPVYVIVPAGPSQLDVFSRAEGALNARGMQLDWRHHWNELVRRTVADTLRLVSWWLPEEMHELLTGPAFAVRGWEGQAVEGMTCPLCQQATCEPGECPMRRVGIRPMFAAPAVAYMMGNSHGEAKTTT